MHIQNMLRQMFVIINASLRNSKNKISQATIALPKGCSYHLTKISALSTQKCQNEFTLEEFGDPAIVPYDAEEQPILHKCSVVRNRKKLATVLKISIDESNRLLTQYPGLRKLSLHELIESFTVCKSFKIAPRIIQRHPWLLLIRKDTFKTKMELIQTLKLDINKVAPLAHQSYQKLHGTIRVLSKEIISQPEDNRIEYLSKALQCPADEISFAIAKYPFFPRISLSRVVEVTELLLGKGVHGETILRDFWVFIYRPGTIETRLQYVLDADVTNIRTWMVRCNMDVLNKTLDRHKANKEILGELSDISEYLSRRLKLDIDYAKLIVNKHPEIKRMNTTKAKEILDYLFSEGFTESQVIRSPRILCCKLKTIQSRQKILKGVGFKPNTLVGFCKSKRQFEIYCKIAKKKSLLSKEANRT